MNIIIYTLVFFCIICIAIASYFWYKQSYIKHISFKEALNLTGLPIITLCQNDIKLNFLLDTGSDFAVINSAIIPSLQYEDTNKTTNNIGIDGIISTSQIINLTLKYEDFEFNQNFTAMDLNRTFSIIKQETGVQLHGILGNVFFEKYKYVIDFKEKKAFIKR